MNRNMEIRLLPDMHRLKLSSILDNNKLWVKLMGSIPNNFDDLNIELERKPTTPKKYTSKHIRIIKDSSESQKYSATLMLFDEWGTSGRKRPTIGNLFNLLIDLQMFRAADYVAASILHEGLPKRPNHGPARRIDIPDDVDRIESQLERINYPRTASLQQAFPSSINNMNKDFNNGIHLNPCKIDLPNQQAFTRSFETISNLTDVILPSLSTKYSTAGGASELEDISESHLPAIIHSWNLNDNKSTEKPVEENDYERRTKHNTESMYSESDGNLPNLSILKG